MFSVFNLFMKAFEELEGSMDLKYVRMVCGHKNILVLVPKKLISLIYDFPYSIDETTDFILMTFPGSIPEGTIDSGTHNSKSLEITV